MSRRRKRNRNTAYHQQSAIQAMNEYYTAQGSSKITGDCQRSGNTPADSVDLRNFSSLSNGNNNSSEMATGSTYVIVRNMEKIGGEARISIGGMDAVTLTNKFGSDTVGVLLNEETCEIALLSEYDSRTQSHRVLSRSNNCVRVSASICSIYQPIIKLLGKHWKYMYDVNFYKDVVILKPTGEVLDR